MMINQIKKLNFSNKQYNIAGGVLMLSGILFCVASAVIVVYSIPMGIVLLCMGLLMGIVGYAFKNADGEEDEREKVNGGNKLFAVIIGVTAGIWIISSICTGFVVSDYFKRKTETPFLTKAEVTTQAKTEIQTQVAQVINAKSEVYVVENGTRYHYSKTCPSGESYKISIQEAMDRGLTPCQKCAKN